MQLYPVGELYAGGLFFPIQRTAEVLHAWRQWTATAPDDVTSIARILRLPPVPELPEALRGRAFAIVEAAYLGDEGSGGELIQPLRRLGAELDTFAMIPPSALGQLNMDPSQPVPAEGNGALLSDFPAAAIDALVAAAGPDAETPPTSSYDYYDFKDTPATAAALLPPASFRRLEQITAAYDPDRMIISSHPVWPTGP
jgi:hypothetical protein